MKKYSYPAPPKQLPENFSTTNPLYQSLSRKVMFRIVLFLLIYVLVIAGAISLSVAGLYASWYLSVHLPVFIGVFLATGVLTISFMLFYFLFKFLFKKQEHDPSLIKITEAEHPDLFEFVYKICEETQAPRPRNIFLSTRVNASVFYDSGLFSLFFAGRKNLEIGLGLVNSLNTTEFKAILAHEFGHFSQRSTRLGSYIYSFNRIIYNLLFENESWLKNLQSVARINVLLAVLCQITLLFVKAVIALFSRLYEFINIPYLALSREMEYQADLVATSVTGSKPIINALHRLEFGESTYNQAFQSVEVVFENEHRLPRNIFTLHSYIIESVAASYKFEIKNHLPVLDSEKVSRVFIKDRVNIRDLWASHPSIKDREANVSRYQLEADNIDCSPWVLFRNKEMVQENFTRKLFAQNFGISTYLLISAVEMSRRFEMMNHNLAFDERYCDFYNYATETMAVPELSMIGATPEKELQDLYNEEVSYKLRSLQKTKQEMDLLRAIQNKEIKVNGFEFDGVNYPEEQAGLTLNLLKNELAQLEIWLQQHKQKIANWFYLQLQKIGDNLAQDYYNLMALRVKTASDARAFIAFYQETSAFQYELVSGKHKDVEINELSVALDRLYSRNHFKISALEDTEMTECYKDIPELTLGYKPFINKLAVRHPHASEQQDLKGIAIMREDIQNGLQQLSNFDNRIFEKIMLLQARVLDQKPKFL